MERSEIEKMVKDAVKEFASSFVARSVNDEDEVGFASIHKLNAKDTYDRHRTWFDVAMGNVDKLEKILINSLAQMMNTMNVADKNLVHNSNVTNKQMLTESGVASDEIMVTDQERAIEILASKIIEKLGSNE